MNILYDTIAFINARFSVSKRHLSFLSDKEYRIWGDISNHTFNQLTKNSSPNSISTETTSRLVTSRLIKKIPLIALTASYKSSKGLLKEWNSIIVQFAFIRLLVNFSALNLYSYYSEKLLPKCIKYGLVWEGYYLCRLLFYRYSSLENNPIKLKKYSILLELLETEYWLERKAEGYYCEIASFYKRKKYHEDEIIKKAKQYDEILENLSSEILNPKFIMLKYLIRLTLSEVTTDAARYIATCDEALGLYDQIGIPDSQGERIFITKKLDALLKTEKYSEFEHFISKVESKFRPYSPVWIHLMEMKITAYLRQLKADNAIIDLQKITTSSSLRHYNSEIIDRFNLYELYANILGENYKILKPNNFILKLQRYRQDLKGMNISLIIAELVHSAMINDFNYLENQSEIIKRYIHKYARKNLRSKWFIQLLLSLPVSRQNWQKWVSLNNRFFDKMAKSKDFVDSIELVDFVLLWSHTCHRALAKNKRFQVYKNRSEPNHYVIKGID